VPRRDLGASLLENVGALAYLAAFMPIRIAEYPQLRLLCWNRTSDAALDEAEAFALGAMTRSPISAPLPAPAVVGEEQARGDIRCACRQAPPGGSVGGPPDGPGVAARHAGRRPVRRGKARGMSRLGRGRGRRIGDCAPSGVAARLPACVERLRPLVSVVSPEVV